MFEIEKKKIFDRSFDCVGEVELVKEEEFDYAQKGFRTDMDGNYVDHWIGKEYYVIGFTTLLGDPIIVKVDDPDYPVYSMFHDDWEFFEKIANSYKDFLSILSMMNETNIDNKEEKKKMVSKIIKMVGKDNKDFWEVILDVHDEESTNLNDEILDDPEKYQKEKQIWEEYSSKSLEELLVMVKDDDQIGQLVLAYKYEKNKEYDKTLSLVNKAIDLGSASALNYLSFLYNYGIGVEKNYNKALELLEKAASMGCATAQSSLGSCYSLGHLVNNADIFKAEYWLTRAAKQGDVNAQRNLGDLYMNNWEFFSSNRDKEALYWYEKAAQQGDMNAAYSIATYYEYREKDAEKAREWIEKSAEMGDERALHKLAELIEQNNDDKEAQKKVFNLYSQSLKQGYIEAKYDLARCYQYGIGVHKSYKKAIKLYEEVIDDEFNKNAIYNLAEIHRQEFAMSLSYEKVANLYYLIFKHANESKFGHVLVDKSDIDGKALSAIAKFQEEGFNIFNVKKTEQFIKWNQKKKEYDDYLQYFFEEISFDLDFFADVEEKKSNQLFDDCFDTQLKKEKPSIDSLFLDKSKEDKIKNNSDFLIEDEKSRGVLEINISELYKKGKYITQSYDKALYWAQQCVEHLKHPLAFYTIIECYLEGKGTELSLEKALYWCNKLIEQYEDRDYIKLNIEILNIIKRTYYQAQEAGLDINQDILKSIEKYISEKIKED